MANKLKYFECCRVCLQKIGLSNNLFDKSFDSTEYFQIIRDITGVKISKDHSFVPIQICGKCEVLLISSYEFRKTFLISNEKLIDFIYQLEDENNIKIKHTYFDEEFNQNSSSSFEDETSEVKVEEDTSESDTEVFIPKPIKTCKVEEFTQDSSSSFEDEPKKDVYAFESESEVVIRKLAKKEKPNKSTKIPRKDKSQRNKVDQKASIKCTLCNITFPNHSEYHLHRRTEHQKMSVCPICGKSMPKPSLNTHLNSVHNNSTDFKCDICQKGFKSKLILDNHIRTFHFKELRFKCLHCDERFVHRMSRNTHTDKVHLKIKRYACKVCPSKFLEANGLRNHVIRHHTGDRNFKCDICGYSFMNVSLLNNHVKAVHSKEKKWSCDICGKKFALNAYLQKHMKIHNTVKDYNCPVCSKGFPLVTPFKSHMKNSHPEYDMPPAGTVLCKFDFTKNIL